MTCVGHNLQNSEGHNGFQCVVYSCAVLMQDKDAQVNCSFPSKLLVNASTLSKNFSEKQLKDDFRPRQRLSDINIMASYDSVLMDTDTGSIRSSKALSSRNGRDGEDEE